MHSSNNCGDNKLYGGEVLVLIVDFLFVPVDIVVLVVPAEEEQGTFRFLVEDHDMAPSCAQSWDKKVFPR